MKRFEDGKRYRSAEGIWILVTDIRRGMYRRTCTVTERGRSSMAHIGTIGEDSNERMEILSFTSADGGFYTVTAGRVSEG